MPSSPVFYAWWVTVAMTSVLTADVYGRYSVGSILGVIFLGHQTGAAVLRWAARGASARTPKRRRPSWPTYSR